MECCNYDTRRFFPFGMRIFFGIWLLYAGAMKWLVIGPHSFVGFITADFDKTWSPHLLNVSLAWLIIFAEPIAALWILSGRHARAAWASTSLLMFLLTIGQTILMKPAVIDNWHYVILTLACAALSERPSATSA